VLGIFQGICEDLVDREARPLKVLLDYKAPDYAKRYEEVFRCPVYFEQPRVEMHFPREYIDRELESYDPQARDALRVLQSGLLSKLSSQKDVVNEVKMALRRRAGEFPRLEDIADKLAMSPRTLRRKLGAANLRYQDLLDGERRLVAEDYLANSDLTVQQIAEKCDFNDAQNFSKAFKRWSGVSPTEYRKSSRT
jgi:AraC-like DNA-binding protein